MKPKQKPCKSMGKSKGFEGCGTKAYKRTYGLCDSCYYKWLLNTPEGQDKVNRSVLTATKPRKELEQAFEDKKDKNKLSLLLQGAKIACHTYIRTRDKGKPCISCGKPYEKGFHAGHYKKAEIYSTLRFNEFNISGQCERCNIFLDGNVQAYSDRLADRIGEDKKAEVERMAKAFKTESFKWDREELKEIRKYYQQKIKQLNNT